MDRDSDSILSTTPCPTPPGLRGIRQRAGGGALVRSGRGFPTAEDDPLLRWTGAHYRGRGGMGQARSAGVLPGFRGAGVVQRHLGALSRLVSRRHANCVHRQARRRLPDMDDDRPGRFANPIDFLATGNAEQLGMLEDMEQSITSEKLTSTISVAI